MKFVSLPLENLFWLEENKQQVPMKKVIIHSFEIPKLTVQPKIKKIKRWRVYHKIKPKISSRATYYTKKMDLERFLNLKLPFIDEVINQL